MRIVVGISLAVNLVLGMLLFNEHKNFAISKSETKTWIKKEERCYAVMKALLPFYMLGENTAAQSVDVHKLLDQHDIEYFRKDSTLVAHGLEMIFNERGALKSVKTEPSLVKR